jgi:nitroimidazol reductase NimA-like FMN-containing flavoprotein (pyridoxamine 5'-phosphate oxidase superfamily)
MTEKELQSYLKTAKIARICSLNNDETIHVAPVWYNYDNGEIVIVTPESSRKVKNLKRNSNVTILIDTSDDKAQAPKGVIIYGKAKLGSWSPSTPELLALLQRYMRKNEAGAYARTMFKLAKWVKVTVKPERMRSFDFRKTGATHMATQERG